MTSGFTEYFKFSTKKNKSILCSTRKNKTLFSFKSHSLSKLTTTLLWFWGRKRRKPRFTEGLLRFGSPNFEPPGVSFGIQMLTLTFVFLTIKLLESAYQIWFRTTPNNRKCGGKMCLKSQSFLLGFGSELQPWHRCYYKTLIQHLKVTPRLLHCSHIFDNQ